MSRTRPERGATLVEAAIVVPLLLLLVFGIVDFGRFIAATSSVNASTRESARYGSSVGDSANGIPRFTDCDEIIAAGVGKDEIADLTAGDVTVEYDHGPGTGVFATCPLGGPTPDPAAFAAGDRITVEISRSFTLITPIISQFFGPVTLESVDRRTLLST